jgi:glycosyltransferase involved in cell wall biosynthesis
MISVIVPAYNEEKKIVDTLSRIRKVPLAKEIIVVDDGSKDKTAEKAGKYARILKMRVNRGKGAAMRAGAKMAKGDILVFIDASQFNPEEIPKLVARMKRDRADMVVGIRDFSIIPWHRRVTNNLTRLAILIGTGRGISDALSGFRVIGKKAFLGMKTKENRYCIESEINFRAFGNRLRVSEVPVTVTYSGERPVKKLGGLRTFWKQRFAHEAVFNTKMAIKFRLGMR